MLSDYDNQTINALYDRRSIRRQNSKEESKRSLIEKIDESLLIYYSNAL